MNDLPKLLSQDMHVHLYGCLEAPVVWRLLKRAEPAKLDWYQREFAKAWGFQPGLESLLQAQECPQEFVELFLVNTPCNFGQFQAKFNLIIAASDLLNPSLVSEVVEAACLHHQRQKLSGAEYRMLFPPWMDEVQFKATVRQMCAELQDFSAAHASFQGRLALSLWRNELGPVHYGWLKQLMNQDEAVRCCVSAVDFCHVEEGNPPKHLKPLFNQILQDNQAAPDSALSILLHVGESFADKSLESAVRWVHQGALLGAHRLGHCLALGLEPLRYLDQQRSETVAERLDQIEYDLTYADELIQSEVQLDRDALLKEQQQLLLADADQRLTVYYNEERLRQVRLRQDWTIRKLREHNVSVESCPTSNRMIGALSEEEAHPIYRFMNDGLPVVLGSDDPGLFGCSLQSEALHVIKHHPYAKQAQLQLEQDALLFRSGKVRPSR